MPDIKASGRWHVQGSPNKRHAELAILDEDGFVVALLGFTGPDEHWIASLLASAPETAAERDRLRAQNAALLELVRGAQRIINHTPPGGVPEQERGDWQRSARAAIAEAEKA